MTPVPHVIATCCRSRYGAAKAVYPSRAAARAAARKIGKKHNIELREYRCRLDPTQWHIGHASASRRDPKVRHALREHRP